MGCIDKPIGAGRWSSLMCAVPASLAACLTSDIALMAYAIFTCSLLYVSSIKISEPRWYRLCRLVTFLPRVSFVAFLFIRAPAVMDGGGLAFIGLLIICVCIVCDLYFGDITSLRCYRYTCKYDIVKTLPNRVFVVQQTGGMIGFERDATYSREQQLIVMGALDPTYKLVADIEGLLVQLDPVTEPMVKAMKLQLEDAAMIDDCSAQRPKFLGMDVFNKKLKSLEEIEAAEQTKDMMAVVRSKTSGDDVHAM